MDVSFITINYNSSKETLELIESIKKMTSLQIDYEIIVVDNASNDEEFSLLQPLNSAEHVTLVPSRINTGFSGGNMLGIQYASGKYYFFINNDTLLRNDVAMQFYTFMENHANTALTTASLFDKDGNHETSYKLFPSVIGSLLGNGAARFFSKKKFPANKAILEKPTPVNVVTGSCMFFRSNVFDRIGGFDTHFFLYCEEEDISQRVWNAGYSVYCIPEAELTHLSGASTKRDIAIEKEFYISYYFLLHKHFTFCSKIILQLMLAIKLLRKSFFSMKHLKLLLFILQGSPMKTSLKYQQKIINKR